MKWIMSKINDIEFSNEDAPHYDQDDKLMIKMTK